MKKPSYKIGMVVILAIAILLFSVIVSFKMLKNSSSIDAYDCIGCNVILISLDTLRSDRLGMNGYGRNTSPELDQLANKGVVFRNAYANGYFTLPSHMSIFTSLYPLAHGVNIPSQYDLSPSRLDEKYKTLAEVLDAHGYSTTWFASANNHNLDLTRGFERGFNHINSSFFPNNRTALLQPERIGEFGATSPFFWFVHATINHAPYIYPEEFNRYFSDQNYNGSLAKNISVLQDLKYQEFARRYHTNQKNVFLNDKLNSAQMKSLMQATDNQNKSDFFRLVKATGEDFGLATGIWDNFLYFDSMGSAPSPKDLLELSNSYDNGVYFMDYLMGQFIDEIEKYGLMNNTIIVITSDHGEELYEHGHFDHNNFYEHTIRVPLMFYLPKLNSKVERNDIVQSIDIAPTIIQLVGLDMPRGWQGNDLFSYSKARQEDESGAYGYSLGSSYVRTQDWKYIKNRNGSEELYYLKDDPKEMKNLESLEKEKLRELSEMVSIWLSVN